MRSICTPYITLCTALVAILVRPVNVKAQDKYTDTYFCKAVHKSCFSMNYIFVF
jgi:hypothetical protein